MRFPSRFRIGARLTASRQGIAGKLASTPASVPAGRNATAANHLP